MAVAAVPRGSIDPTGPIAEQRRRWPTRLRGALRRFLDQSWGDARIAAGAAMAVVALWALLAGWWMPRGPLTAAAALLSLVVSVAVGFVAGLVANRRWPVLVAPVVFAVVVEVVRLDLTGPTVDAPVLSQYGWLALAVGRGFHGLVTLLPLAWGAAVGAGVARRWAGAAVSDRTRGRTVLGGARRAGAVLVGVALIALAAGIARPASTSQIRGVDGERVAGSVAELTSVRLNGRDQPLMIRGHDVGNPVLLFLAGGPGGSELGAMRRHLPDLERHFTVVTWDQRGTGKAYPSLDPTDTVSLEGYVGDTLAVTDHLRERFDQDRIYLLGQSWGSTLGVLAAQQSPDRYAAFIGAGQMVSQRATDRIFYAETLAWAEETGRQGLADELVSIGEPPYDSMLDYETALSYEHQVHPYDRSTNSEGEGGFSENFLVSEYSLVEQVHLLAGFMDTFAVLYPQLQEIDFRRTVTELEVPVFFVQGRHEAPGRARLFEQWHPRLDAPVKDVTYFETSGHRPLFEQPGEFVTYMVDTVLARTADR